MDGNHLLPRELIKKIIEEIHGSKTLKEINEEIVRLQKTRERHPDAIKIGRALLEVICEKLDIPFFAMFRDIKQINWFRWYGEFNIDIKLKIYDMENSDYLYHIEISDEGKVEIGMTLYGNNVSSNVKRVRLIYKKYCELSDKNIYIDLNIISPLFEGM